jgi:hypothetical protein
LAAARKQISGTFSKLMTKDRLVPITDEFNARLLQIEDEAISPFLDGAKDPVGSTIDRLREHIKTGGLDAETLMKLQSRLGKQGRQKLRGENSNPELGHALLDIQELLLDAAAGVMTPAERQAFQQARAQYRTLSTLETGNIVNAETGDVSAPLLANQLQRRDPRGFLEGENRSPLYEGARVLGRLQKPKSSSGTAERQYLGQALAGAGTVGGAAAGYGSGGDVESSLKGAATGLVAGMAAPRALGHLYLRGAGRDFPEGLSRAAGQAMARAVGESPPTFTGPEFDGDLIDLLRELEGR